MELTVVKRAAILVDGFIWTVAPPRRHHDVIALYFAETGARLPAGAVQGFLTDDGFMTREQAARLAFEAGQIAEPKDMLFTEDLW